MKIMRQESEFLNNSIKFCTSGQKKPPENVKIFMRGGEIHLFSVGFK